MGRRKKTSTAEDIIELVAKLPWWVGVVLAVAFYFWLHDLAARPMAAAGPSSGLMLGALWRGLASAGQYILPILCMAGAGVSAWRRRQRSMLAADVAHAPAADVLNGMTWREFEMLVGEGFRLQGYQVDETGGGGADGGVDLVLSRPTTSGREKTLVQCKQWRAHKVGVDVVRELYGVMAARGASAGVVVSSGSFTHEAVAFASGRNVRLIDGPALRDMIRAVRGPQASAVVADAQTVRSEPRLIEAPSCPICSKPMTLRTAKRGAKAGSDFWGCPAYPACRGTRPIN